MMHPEGAEAMTDVIRGALNDLFGELPINWVSRAIFSKFHWLPTPSCTIWFWALIQSIWGAPFALTIDDAVTMPVI